MRRTTISLPDDLAKALEREARRRDASVSAIAREALAERLDAETVITLDRRHFTVIRPRHRPALELLPAGRSARSATRIGLPGPPAP